MYKVERTHGMSTSKKATDGGKGSRKRTRQVSRETDSENYDRVYPAMPIDKIRSAIAGMRKKGLCGPAIEVEILKEHGTVITLGEIRELMG